MEVQITLDQKKTLLKHLGVRKVATDETYINPIFSDFGLQGNGVTIDLLSGELSINEEVRQWLSSHDDMLETYKICEIFEYIFCNSSFYYMDGNDFAMYSAECFFFADFPDKGDIAPLAETPIWAWPYTFDLLTERLIEYGKANLEVHWDVIEINDELSILLGIKTENLVEKDNALDKPVIAPNEVIKPNLTLTIQWLQEHAHEHSGLWVAIKDGVLLGKSVNKKFLLDILAENDNDFLITKIP